MGGMLGADWGSVSQRWGALAPWLGQTWGSTSLCVLVPSWILHAFPHSSRDAWDALCGFDFWIAGLSVHAFLVGGGPHHLKPSQMSLVFDGSVLLGASIPLSSLPSSPLSEQ